ncbi:MAG TPA: nucleotide sugar dehydrogenase [Acidimicrobiia bacterium]|nr:nucleotide sugar dehydrogenase [Acidimicrobiia bacterium]
MTDRADFFANERWTAGVIGLGYVGLPLAVNAAARGLDVIGFDVDEAVVAALVSGESPIGDVSSDDLADALAAGLTVTADESALEAADALFICVPSPLNRHRQPDLSFIEAAAATVERVTHPGLLVSLESTTYPGTTDDVLVPAATSGGLRLDEDVFVAFSAERVNPGSGFDLAAIPKVVGGVTRESGRVASAAYGRLIDSVHLVSSARAAEMTKLLENTYRAVNIGLVNEMAALTHEIDVDIWEVVEAAATKPFGFQPFYPGPGVGGHCIPLDPQYLAWRAKEAGFATRFIDLTEEVNSRMPEYVATRIAEMLNERGLPVHGTTVLAVGLAYKAGVGDARESPALDVIAELRSRGARVAAFDPLVGDDEIDGFDIERVEGLPDGVTLAVILTDHDVFDFKAIAESADIVFDTRGAYRRRGMTLDNVVAL